MSACRNARPPRGAKLMSRDGHPVTVMGAYREDGVWFAAVSYDDGFVPGPVGGRVGGTESSPYWEHRVANGKVVRPGGDYYNPDDWVVEKGLRTREEGTS